MKLHELAKQLRLEVLHPGIGFDREVTGGYCADLPSDALGHAKEGMIWITTRPHKNVIAVASLKKTAVLFIGSVRPDREILRLAREADVSLLYIGLSAFDAVGDIFRELEKS